MQDVMGGHGFAKPQVVVPQVRQLLTRGHDATSSASSSPRSGRARLVPESGKSEVSRHNSGQLGVTRAIENIPNYAADAGLLSQDLSPEDQNQLHEHRVRFEGLLIETGILADDLEAARELYCASVTRPSTTKMKARYISIF